MLPAQGDDLGDAQPVSVHHQKQGMVADAVAALLCRSEQPVDLRLAEVVSAALVGIRSIVIANLDISPVGHRSVALCKSLLCMDTRSTTFYTRHLV